MTAPEPNDDLPEFSKRLGALEDELTEAARTGDVRGQIRLHYARAAAWHAFADIQRAAGRDHIPALGAAARDEAQAARLGGHNDGPTKDPVSHAAGAAAVIGLWIFPILFGPLAVILGLASRRNDWRSASAIIMGIGEVVFYLYTVGVIHA